MMYGNSGKKRISVDKERLTFSTVTRTSFQEFIPVNGVVLPLKTVFLDAIEGGRVEEIFVEDGSTVTKGDLILRLSNSGLQMEYMTLEARLLEQINELRNTRIALEERGLQLKDELLDTRYRLLEARKANDRNSELHASGVIPKAEYETSRDEWQFLVEKKALIKEKIRKDSLLRSMQVSQVDASLVLMNRNLQVLHSNLDNLEVRAPISGQLTSLDVELGESVAKGGSLGQIDVLNGFKVTARIDDHYVSRVVVGQACEFNLNSNPVALRIKKVFPNVENGMFEANLEFVDGIPTGVRRGQTIQVKIALSEPAEALQIRRGSFFNTTGGQWIYVYDQNKGSAYRKDIRIGRQNPSHYEVLEGLKEGEVVVTSEYRPYNEADELMIQ